MARCGCSEGTCACAVAAADTPSVATSVSGVGTVGSPYTFQAEAILVPDGTGPLSGENALKEDALGLYVEPAGAAPDCSWAYVLGDNDSLSLVAGTTDSYVVSWDLVSESTAGWSVAGGLIVPPNPDSLYVCSVLADFSAGSGADAVNAGVTVSDSITSWLQKTYLPSGFDGSIVLSRPVRVADLVVTMSIDAPAAATRSVGGATEIMLVEVGSCPSV